MAPNEDVIAYRSSAWSRPCANRAHMMKSTVGANLGGSMHSDRTAVRNNKTRSNLSVGINIDHCHYDEQLSYDAKDYPCWCPKPRRS